MRLTSPGLRLTAKPRFRIRYALVALGIALLLGTVGFHLTEGWAWHESLYATAQTVTTVGYGDYAPRTAAGRLFASFFMFFGFGVVAYILTSTVQWIVQSELVATFGERRRQREMSKLQDHFIICGAGRVGLRVIQEMEKAGVPFVVIETDEQKVAQLTERYKREPGHAAEHIFIRDATLEATLKEAGVERARGLAACLPNDADNVYIVLTAHALNSNLKIVARAIEEQARATLAHAGASSVIALTKIGGERMAQALLKPLVGRYLDSLAENLHMRFEQFEVAPTSIYAGKEIRSTNIRSELNLAIVAICSGEKDMEVHPPAERVIEAGDTIVVIGHSDKLEKFNQLALGVNNSKAPNRES